jgi:hypothetical protein
MSSFIEGGNFKCPPTGFETAEREEWNNHCLEDCDKHTMHGATTCQGCGDIIQFKGLPFQPFKADGTIGIALRCDECEEKSKGNVQITNKLTKETLR